jgi:hypothetical protein
MWETAFLLFNAKPWERDMARRTPDIFMSPKQLNERAEQSFAASKKMTGKKKSRAIEDGEQDNRMADLKRMTGEGEGDQP